MMRKRFSRRRLLGSVLATLTGWLLPPRHRTHAAPHLPTPLRSYDPNKDLGAATYTYNAFGQCISVTHHPPHTVAIRPCLSSDWSGVLQGDITVYRYDAHEE